MNNNEKTVRAIVETMEKYASGEYFLHNGELFPIDENEFSKVDGCKIRQENVCGDIHIFYVMPDGTMVFEGDIEIATIGDYFNDLCEQIDEFFEMVYNC